ncbi:bifunctional metallophosphatase/5'-nucleotidase [Tessaracoccus lapidicaptus]|uniref:bifunctional metallophosphatase/5'-nucleotidase n=1 Tax=Tessaracoccus lapidicaptus TaxID=1427523 RepID=UPI00333E2BB1
MSRTTRRATATFAATALVAGSVALTTFTPASAAPGECVAPTGEVTVFGFNDFHGRLSEAAQLFTPVEEARVAVGEDNVLLLSSGDNIGASTFDSMILDDTPTLDVLNAIGLDASAVGNHEFDKGWSDLSGRVVPQSDFPYLGANVYTAGTTTVAAPLQAYELFEKGGVTIAVVGAVTDDVPSLVSPAGITGLSFGDPVEAVNRVTDQLLDGDAANGEADVVLASFHEGAADGDASAADNAAASTAFASIYQDVDARVSAIFNGHTHQEYTWTTDAGVPVVQAGSYGSMLAQLVLSVDDTTGAVCGAPEVSLVEVPEEAGTSARLTEVTEIVAAASEEAGVLGAEVIGEASEAVSTAGDGTAGTRDQESPMSNLVAQMFAETLGEDDPEFIGVQNPGGTRDSFDAGEVTYQEAAMVLPFANSLFTTELTGAQVKTLLEQQWQRNSDGEVPSRAFLQLGLSDNVTYTYDESLPEGERITSIMINGAPIDPAKVYTVGSGSFLISGGDNFHVLADGANTRDTGRADLEAWVAWVAEQGTLSPDYSKRGVSASLPEGALVEGGAALTYTFGQPLAGGVAPQTLDMYLLEGDKVSPVLENSAITAYVGEVVVGTATVTEGVATIQVALPQGADVDEGEQLVRFEVAESGTEILVPVTVELVDGAPVGDDDEPTPPVVRPGLPSTGN